MKFEGPKDWSETNIFSTQTSFFAVPNPKSPENQHLDKGKKTGGKGKQILLK